MAEAEQPHRLLRDHNVSVDDVRQLMGSSTPHFALQLRGRIHKLIRSLPADHPARVLGEHEMHRLEALATTGEARGEHAQPGERALPSMDLAGRPLVDAGDNTH